MATIVNLKCENCNKNFEVKKGREKKTCSNLCKIELRKKKDLKFYIRKKCQSCGNDFTSKKKENKKYCSYKCMGNARMITSREIRKCVNCDNYFNVRRKDKKKLCSKDCRVEWNSKTENIKSRIDKSKKALIEKYGVDTYFKLDQHKSNMVNWYKENVGDNKNALKKLKEKRDDKLIDRLKKNGFEVVKIKNKNLTIKHPDGHLFSGDRKLLVNRLNHNTELSTKLLPISAPKSTLELKIIKILDQYKIEYSTNVRDLLPSKKEIDIYVKSHNLCIELNGLHWHSEYYVNKEYHLNKMNECNHLGLQLLQFFEDEIIEKFEIVESIIKTKLNINDNTIFAEKCEVNEINNSDIIKNFLEKNHIEGFVNSNINFGLFFNGDLVSLMIFDKKYKCQLLRFCNKKNYVVLGAENKLFDSFINKYNPEYVIAYGDLRYLD